MDTSVAVVHTLLGLGAIPALFRLIRGPGLSDRATALDVLMLLLASAIAAEAAVDGDETFTPVLIVVALVAFLATSAIARYAEWRTGA